MESKDILGTNDNCDRTLRSLQELSIAAKSQLRLMSQLACLKFGLPVQSFDLNDHEYNCDDPDGLKSRLTREAFYRIEDEITDIGIFVHLYKWVSSVDDELISDAFVALNHVKMRSAYKKEFYDSFDREVERSNYMSDPLTPVGTVHYRISFSFCKNKGIFVAERNLVTDSKKLYWQENKLWFDYFGPKEDENGLIRYLDY